MPMMSSEGRVVGVVKVWLWDVRPRGRMRGKSSALGFGLVELRCLEMLIVLMILISRLNEDRRVS